jgi:hypothetical protein
LYIFHHDHSVQDFAQFLDIRSFQTEPEDIIVRKDGHLGNHLSLRIQMRGIGALTRKQFLDVVCHHALEPGNSIRTGKTDQAPVPGLAKNCSTMPGGMILLGMMKRECQSW